jgi:diaminopimelate decarboxylase
VAELDGGDRPDRRAHRNGLVAVACREDGVASVDSLIARYFGTSGGELTVGEIPVSDLARQYGTPMYVYDSGVIDRKWAALRAALPAEFAIHYSVKANPNPAIVRHLLAKGAGLEVASGGELCEAITAGCPPADILFAGPGKSEVELEMAITYGIGEVHVESVVEAERVAAIATRLGVRARAALRVNPAAEAQGGAMRMGGKAAPFGVDEECLDAVLDVMLAEPGIEFRGLHLFSGTQILDYSVLVQQYRCGLDIARRVAKRVGHPLQTLDFGGGLGIPYFAKEEELDTGRLREELDKVMVEVRTDGLFSGTRFVVEPGRYLVGEAGVYLTRITDIKVSRGRTFYIVDGGMHHHLAASGNLGQVIKRNFPVAIVNRLGRGPTGTVDVVGPLCTPLDTLARDIALGQAEVGDVVGIFQSGAYGLTASPIGFLSHRTPAEVLVGDGRARVIRSRSEWTRPVPWSDTGG